MPPLSPHSNKAASEWDSVEPTPHVASKWDATPGPGHVDASRWESTPGAGLGAGETPAWGDAGPTPKRNRWDDATPGRPGDGGGWQGETPAAGSAAAVPKKPRSRWDETPANAGPSATPGPSAGPGITPGFFTGATPAAGAFGAGMETPATALRAAGMQQQVKQLMTFFRSARKGVDVLGAARSLGLVTERTYRDRSLCAMLLCRRCR